MVMMLLHCRTCRARVKTVVKQNTFLIKETKKSLGKFITEN